MKVSVATRLRLALAVLAWLAQALMPVAHAAIMGAPRAPHGVGCGDPAQARQALALLPAELRAALDDGAVNADQVAGCTLLCALGSAPPPTVDIAPVVSLRAAGLEPVAAEACCPPGPPQASTPPAQAPPRA